jgi:hypothetical protein
MERKKRATLNSKCFNKKGLEKNELKTKLRFHIYIWMYVYSACKNLSKNKLKDVKSGLALLTKIYLK